MARNGGIQDSVGVVRDVTGAPAVADSGTLTDANISPTLAVNCRGFDTVFVGVELTGGTSPTATVEPLFRDAEAPDGSRWKRRLLGARPGVTLAAIAADNTGALGANSDFVELRVHGAEAVFFRISAVANNPTNIKVLVAPGQVRPRL